MKKEKFTIFYRKLWTCKINENHLPRDLSYPSSYIQSCLSILCIYQIQKIVASKRYDNYGQLRPIKLRHISIQPLRGIKSPWSASISGHVNNRYYFTHKKTNGHKAWLYQALVTCDGHFSRSGDYSVSCCNNIAGGQSFGRAWPLIIYSIDVTDM